MASIPNEDVPKKFCCDTKAENYKVQWEECKLCIEVVFE